MTMENTRFQTVEGMISNIECVAADGNPTGIKTLKLSIDLLTPVEVVSRSPNTFSLLDLQYHSVGIICHQSCFKPLLQPVVSSTTNSLDPALPSSIMAPASVEPGISSTSQNMQLEAIPYANVNAIEYYIQSQNAQLSVCTPKQFGRCPICYESILQREPTVTKCGHVFCRECILKSLAIVRKCPLCQCRVRMNQLLRIYL